MRSSSLASSLKKPAKKPRLEVVGPLLDYNDGTGAVDQRLPISVLADEAHLVETCAQRFTFHKVLDARTVPELCAIIEQDRHTFSTQRPLPRRAIDWPPWPIVKRLRRARSRTST